MRYAGKYPDYVAALEERFPRQSALRREMSRYQALFEEGLIPQELYDDLKRSVGGNRAAEKLAAARNRLGYSSANRKARYPFRSQ
jgi:Na+:H+ antiporter